MPDAKAVSLKVFDLNGKILLVKNIEAKAGINRLDILKTDLESSGVMYYELNSGSERLMHKMLLIK